MLGFAALYSAACPGARLRSGARHSSGSPTSRLRPPATSSGTVVDEAGKPLDGVVVSALGGSTSFAVSRQGRAVHAPAAAARSVSRSRASAGLSHRAQHDGRRAARGADRFVVHAAPRGHGRRAARDRRPAVGATAIGAPATPRRKSRRSRRKRDRLAAAAPEALVLKDAETLAGVPRDDDFVPHRFVAVPRSRRRNPRRRRRPRSSRISRSAGRSTC